jgi:hypothetical protein
MSAKSVQTISPSPDLFWEGPEGRRYWMEVTRRHDIGRDLNTPVAKENGQPFWSYSLINDIRAGDVVLHYSTPRGAVIGWSLAATEAWVGEVVWGALGRSAREKGIVPHPRPGWWLGLSDFTPLDPPLRKTDVAERARELDGLIRGISAAGERPYCPFSVNGDMKVRANQGYLFRVPVALIRLFETTQFLGDAIHNVPVAAISSDSERNAEWVAYEDVPEVVSTRTADPWSRDPDAVDRSLGAHGAIQNALAHLVQKAGYSFPAKRRGRPNVDLMWVEGDVLVVAEVKSLSRVNEERQLRLGLGQVLRFSHQLQNAYPKVRSVLAVEHEPSDPAWIGLCAAYGVALVWPGCLDAAIGCA